MLISFSSRIRDLPTLKKSTKSRLNDNGVAVLDCPTNSPDLNPIEKQKDNYFMKDALGFPA